MNANSAPECDGNGRQALPCDRAAVWQLKAPADREFVHGACAAHLHQVSTRLLGGERGQLDMRRIRTEER